MLTLIKVFPITTVASLGLVVFTTVAAAGYLFSGGIATVSVDTPDTDLSIPVPLRVIDIGLGAAELAIPDAELDAVKAELDELESLDLDELKPLFREITREVATFPEGEIVRVEGHGDETVVIEQRRGRFIIEVDGPDTHVRVSAPRKAMGRILKKSFGFIEG